MFGLGKIRLRGLDKKYISDDAHVEDYKNAPAIGRVRFGELCFYYRDLGVKYYVPYESIERAFIRISENGRLISLYLRVRCSRLNFWEVGLPSRQPESVMKKSMCGVRICISL